MPVLTAIRTFGGRGADFLVSTVENARGLCAYRLGGLPGLTGWREPDFQEARTGVRAVSEMVSDRDRQLIDRWYTVSGCQQYDWRAMDDHKGLGLAIKALTPESQLISGEGAEVVHWYLATGRDFDSMAWRRACLSVGAQERP